MSEHAFNLLSSKNFEEALSYFENAIQNSPQDATLLASRARCYIGTGQLERAEEDISKAMSLDSYNPHTQLALGEYQIAKDDFEAGSETFKKTAQLNQGANDQHVNEALGVNTDSILKYLGHAIQNKANFNDDNRETSRGIMDSSEQTDRSLESKLSMISQLLGGSNSQQGQQGGGKSGLSSFLPFAAALGGQSGQGQQALNFLSGGSGQGNNNGNNTSAADKAKYMKFAKKASSFLAKSSNPNARKAGQFASQFLK